MLNFLPRTVWSPSWVFLFGLLLTACRPPDRGSGLYVAHPEDWGKDLIAIYDGTFSDSDRNIRIRRAPMEGHALVVNLEYPTAGRANADIEDLLDRQLTFLLAYLERNPEASATLVGFSQGGCLVLDVLTRLAAREPEALGRVSLALIAPARGVKLGRSTAVAKRMIARCSAAELAIADAVEQTGDGALAELIHERTWIAWSCTDEFVGHDSFEVLHQLVSPEHTLYRQRLYHVPWTAKDQDPSKEGEVYLASAIALAVSQGVDPREALADYGGFDEPCSDAPKRE